MHPTQKHPALNKEEFVGGFINHNVDLMVALSKSICDLENQYLLSILYGVKTASRISNKESLLRQVVDLCPEESRRHLISLFAAQTLREVVIMKRQHLFKGRRAQVLDRPGHYLHLGGSDSVWGGFVDKAEAETVRDVLEGDWTYFHRK